MAARLDQRGFGELTRREFSRDSILALLGGVTVTLWGCGGGGGGGSGMSGPSAGGPGYGLPSTVPDQTGSTRQGRISNNHGHVALVTAVEFSSTETVMLDIQGSADHPHQLELTVEELATIANGEALSKESTVTQASVGTHSHTVSFDPASPISTG